MTLIIGIVVGCIVGALSIGTLAYNAGLRGEPFLIWKPLTGAKK